MILSRSPLEFFASSTILHHLGPNAEKATGLCSQGSVRGGGAHLGVRVPARGAYLFRPCSRVDPCLPAAIPSRRSPRGFAECRSVAGARSHAGWCAARAGVPAGFAWRTELETRGHRRNARWKLLLISICGGRERKSLQLGSCPKLFAPGWRIT